MNNRHLYRGKRLDNGKWVIGYYCYIGQYSEQKHYIIPKYASAFYGLEVDPATVSRCTGLIAAKSYRGESEENRLVFEGDILKAVIPKKGTWSELTIGYGAVFYEGGSYRVPNGNHPNDCVRLDSYAPDVIIEIIGNIWDNPELLEVGND